jgi:hypothetical protein
MSRKKTGGRQKGTPNKTTKEYRQLICKFVVENESEFFSRMQSLDDKTFCSMYLKMIEMNLPKIKPLFHSALDGSNEHYF